ncbi:MAG TPA: RNA polymerase sigma factor [Solirubrobacteraceae bacterium]|nr:RNA polymerase sigma factor [Solirubrobacteraceae bacterium]
MSPRYASASDSELVRASVADPTAFEVLFDRHAAQMRGWLAGQVGGVESANDLLAETFAQAWRSRRRFSGEDPDAGAAWLYGIARNLLRQHYKRGRAQTTARRRLGMSVNALHEDDLDAVLERVDAAALQPRLAAAMHTLPFAQRRAVGHRVVNELGYDEVADELHCSAENARARVSRGLRTLNALLKGVQA